MSNSTQNKLPINADCAVKAQADERSNCSLAESMTHASIDSMTGLDTDLRIVIWNHTAAVWSGLSYEEVAGKTLQEVFPTANEVPGLEEALRRALEGIKSFLPSTGHFYLKGHFEVHIVPLRDNTGGINGVMQIIHDVAHRLKAENELRELNRQLFRQNNALATAHEELASFAKITAHDLKEPLRKIYTFAEMIMMHEADKLSNSGRANFRRIQKSVQRMGLLTDDIVNFSALSRTDAATEVNMNELLEQELERFRDKISETEAIIKSTSLPIIKGHKLALTQLLRQLIDNALKFQKPGLAPQIQINCELVASSQLAHTYSEPDTSFYHLSVSDNGIGFEPKYQQLIFELFQRLHPEGTHRGSGIGLALAQKAARMHNGFMKVESAPGEGSTFHCYIPAL